MKDIQECQAIYTKNSHWKVCYVPNFCNIAAHNLAAWAVQSSVCAFINTAVLLPDVSFCDLNLTLLIAIQMPIWQRMNAMIKSIIQQKKKKKTINENNNKC